MNLSKIRLVLAYAAALVGSLWLGYQLRFDFAVPPEMQQTYLLVFGWVIGIKLLCLWRFRRFDVLPGYFSPSDFSRLLWILLATAFVVFGVSPHIGWTYAPPRSVVLIDFSFSLLALTGLHLVFRQLQARAARPAPNPPRQRARRAGIVGAGLVGTALAHEFATRRDLGLQAVAFFDDDRLKWGKSVLNVPVVGAPETLLNGHANLELEEVIIAMPSAPARRVAEIVRTLQRLKIKFSTVPSIYELSTGQAKVGQLRKVDVQELLGREQVQLATDDIQKLLQNRVVMVTGAGGSIGSELCRQIASFSPGALLLVEQSEVQLFQIEQELIESGHGQWIVPLVANVQDEPRMEYIFQRYEPAVVFHAAAHKHVPMMESQPGEAVKNNALGTLRLAEICVRHGTDRFVLISSDKAINPTNVMGATKRLAEMCVQSLYESHPGATRFMAVRFGNVLGSSGSVVPIFNRQIAAGGPVKVTHPEVTRYFMTIPEAVGLVLQSATMGFGGEIFTLDMGKPVKIVDLARQLIEIAGFTPDKDIRIEFTGLRPGEKLFEELSYQGEHIAATRHPKIMQLLGDALPFERVRRYVFELVAQLDQLSPDEIRCLLQHAVPEYRPQFHRLPPGLPRDGEALLKSAVREKPNGHRPRSALALEQARAPGRGHGSLPLRNRPTPALRILAVTNIYPSPTFPGRGVFVEEQIKGLRAIGLEVRVLFVDRWQEGPLVYYRMQNRLRSLVDGFDPDVIHVMYGGVMADQVARHRGGRPVVVTFHGSDLLGENLSGWTRKIISGYGVHCSRRAARAADGVVVVARHLVPALRDAAPPDRIRVIPCGIDLERFRPMDSLLCKQKLGWRTDAFHVLFASSNGDPVKRPELAGAAVARMSHAGRPPELHYLTGIPNKNVPVWLNASDVLLLTSLHEGSPTVVKEAIACGLPVVSVDVGDVAERIEAIEGCHLARPEPAHLAAKLCRVRQSARRLECGMQLEELSILSVARKLKQCYEEIARPGKPALRPAFPDRLSVRSLPAPDRELSVTH